MPSLSIKERLDKRDCNSGWDFFTDADPTHGNVEYVSKEEALSSGLAYVGGDNVTVLAIDNTTYVPVGGNHKS